MLGYPDRGLSALLSTNLDLPFTSTYTRSTSVPYAQALSPDAALTGRNLERDLRHVIDQFAPTLVLAPAPEDLHPDHAASGRLTRQILEARNKPWNLWYYIVHAGRHWPEPRGLHPDEMLAPPEWCRSPLAASRPPTQTR
jgi:LmbE family N-acetylglucosaminyl deacetylase